MGLRTRVVACLVVLFAGACAGKSVRNGNRGDTGGDPSTGGAGGTSTGGSAGTETGGSGETQTGGSGGTANGGSAAGNETGGSAGSATGGSAGAECSLPSESGNCNGFYERYAFDQETGLCLPFIFTGCGGNANSYASQEECYAACDRSAGMSPAACERDEDCVTDSILCCACQPAHSGNVVSVNASSSGLFQRTKCARQGCDACLYSDDIGWFRNRCIDRHCVARDVRSTHAVDCTMTSECHLRNGVACCEACESNYATLISVNDQALDVLCPNGPMTCPACPNGGPVYSKLAAPSCTLSGCRVVYNFQ